MQLNLLENVMVRSSENSEIIMRLKVAHDITIVDRMKHDQAWN